MLKIIICFFSVIFCIHHFAFAECHGKADVGPAFVSLDIIESGRTIETIDMVGARADATILVWKGFCLKPTVTLAKNRGDGRLATGGIGIGHYIPVNDQICVLPSVGIIFTEIKTHVDFDLGLGKMRFKEKFRSKSPYVGLEVSYTLCNCWKFTAVAQYAWSRTYTKIDPILFAKDHSNGPNFGLLIDYMINDSWSVNVGAGYNSSLSKEKHGIRGKGAKAALAYWF